jgi:hypothetical protein
MVINPRGGLWTLSARAWFAIFAVAISVLGAWVGLSATGAPAVPSTDGSGAGNPVVGTSSSSAPNPSGGDPPTEATGAQLASLSIAEPPLLGQTAAEVLALLVVRAPDLSADYQRTQQFGEAWLDVDANGCNTREDILLRDLSDAVVNGCKVMSGTVADPYSGETIEFVRGNDTSMLLQIDHIVSLYDSWTTGAQELTQDQRQRLANDPTNLLAVSEETNQSKGAEDAATWLPPFAAMHCEYAARQISVKLAYDLWVTPAEHDALAAVLRNCPDQPAYRSWLGAPATALGFAPAPGQTESPVDAGSVYYENCSAAYAAGASNIPLGGPGYRPELDGDSDGIACEG